MLADLWWMPVCRMGLLFHSSGVCVCVIRLLIRWRCQSHKLFAAVFIWNTVGAAVSIVASRQGIACSPRPLRGLSPGACFLPQSKKHARWNPKTLNYRCVCEKEEAWMVVCLSVKYFQTFSLSKNWFQSNAVGFFLWTLQGLNAFPPCCHFGSRPGLSGQLGTCLLCVSWVKTKHGEATSMNVHHTSGLNSRSLL